MMISLAGWGWGGMMMMEKQLERLNFESSLVLFARARTHTHTHTYIHTHTHTHTHTHSSLQGQASGIYFCDAQCVKQNTPSNKRDLECLRLPSPTAAQPGLEFMIFPPLQSQGYLHPAPGSIWFGVPLSSKPEFVGDCFGSPGRR